MLLLLKSIYGLRTSGGRWYERLEEALIKLGFKPCLAGVSLWFRQNDDGTYDFIAIYVDDLFVVAKDATSIISSIRVIFNLKGE